MEKVGGLVLDSGALIALERNDASTKRVLSLLAAAERVGAVVVITANVIAQTWRGGPRQTRLARLLAHRDVETPVLDLEMAREVGLEVGRTDHPDIVDVQVVIEARARGFAVVTSDPRDLRRVDSTIRVVVV